MTTPITQRHYLEINRQTLRVASFADRAIVGWSEVSLVNPDAVKGALAPLIATASEHELYVNGAAINPFRTFWHASSAEEAPRFRTSEEMQAFSAALPHRFRGDLALTYCLAANGEPITPHGNARWLLGVTPVEAMLPLLDQVSSDRRIASDGIFAASMVHIGAVSATMANDNRNRVVLWELAENKSQLILITANGVEAVVSCAIGSEELFDAIQASLGLRARGAAERLFANDDFDCTDIAGKVGERFASVLKPALAGLAKGNSPFALFCPALLGTQQWFIDAVSSAAGMIPWQFDRAKTIKHLQLTPNANVNAGGSPGAYGLLYLAAMEGQPSQRWCASWWAQTGNELAAEDTTSPMEGEIAPEPRGNTAPIVEVPPPAPVPVPQPAPAAPAPKPAPAPTPAPAPKPAPAPAPAAPAPKPAPAPAPAAKPAPAAAKPAPAPEKPAPAPAAKAAPAPAAKAAPAPEKPAPAKPVAKAAVETKPKSSDTVPPSAKKGGSKMPLIAAAIAVIALGIGGYFYMDGQSKAKAAEEQRVAEAAKLQKERDAEKRAAEVRLREIQAEAEKQKKLAEAERLVAMEQARKQAEEQTRQQLSQQFDAERKTKFPGILVVTTQPTGASVVIDNELPRTSPFSLNTIQPGKHRVSISLMGYETLETVADIVGGETTDLGMIQLEKAMGSVEIASTPADVQFTLRQANAAPGAAPVRTGRTPMKIDDVAPGDYVVSYQRIGWAERTVPVQIAKGKTASANVQFKGGSVVLTSYPAGAQVTRGGIAVGVTPVTLSGLPAQKVEYEFNLAGHEKAVVSGNVVENQSITLNASLLSFDRVSLTREVKTQAKPLNREAPKIDPAVPVGSTITITFVVDRNGTTRDHTFQLKEKTDNAVFAQRCIDAVKQWKFSPAISLEGKPINVRLSVPFTVNPGQQSPDDLSNPFVR